MLGFRCFAARVLTAVAALSLAVALVPLCAYATSADGSVDLPLDSDQSTVTVPDDTSSEDAEAAPPADSADAPDEAERQPEGDQSGQDGLREVAQTALNMTIPVNVRLTSEGSGTLKLSQALPAKLEGEGSFQNNSKCSVYLSEVECAHNNVNTVFTGTPTLRMTTGVEADGAPSGEGQAAGARMTWESAGNATGRIYAADAQGEGALEMQVGQQVDVHWQLGLEGSSFNLEELAQAGLDASEQLLKLKWTFSAMGN